MYHLSRNDVPDKNVAVVINGVVSRHFVRCTSRGKNFFLTQFGLVTPFAIMDFCQQVQIMFVVRRPQANIQTNVDVSAIGHISVTFYLILKTSDSRTSKMSDMVLTSICFESTIVLEVQKYFFFKYSCQNLKTDRLLPGCNMLRGFLFSDFWLDRNNT